jgi:hypothetical protein
MVDTVKIIVVRVAYDEPEPAVVEEIVTVFHAVHLESLFVRRRVGVVIAETVIGRYVEIVVQLEIILAERRAVAEVAGVDYEVAAVFIRPAVYELKILGGASHENSGIVMKVGKKRKFHTDA